MASLRSAPLLGALAFLTCGAAQAAETFDNPGMGTTPCVVLNNFGVRTGAGPDGQAVFRGTAEVGNLCGRSVFLSFCFRLVEPANNVDRQCYGGVIRPWGQTSVEHRGSPVRIAGPEYQWRFLP